MRLRTLAAVLIGAAILPTFAARAQDAASARSFVQSLYALYTKNGKGVTLTSRYYDSTLLQLVTADNRLNKGEIGVLEGDPVCGCQDWSGIWDLNIDVKMESPARAVATVSFALAAPASRTKDDLRKIEITLVPERGQWRIYDIYDQSDPKAPFDLRKELERDIASLSKKPS